MMINQNIPPLVASQQWKLWVCGILLAVGGVANIFPDKLTAIFGVDSSVIVLFSLILAFAGFIGAALWIQCPQCGLKLFWYSVSLQDSNNWLAWLFSVKVCPRCEFPKGSMCGDASDSKKSLP